MSNINVRYFIYSREQEQKIIDANLSAGKRSPKFGRVIVNGVPKVYTEKSFSPNSRFADAIVLTSGNEYKISYTNPVY